MVRGFKFGYNKTNTKTFKPTNHYDKFSLIMIRRECKTCHNQFTIINQEVDFLKKLDFPLPVDCPKCRKEKREKLVDKPFYEETKCDNCGTNILIWHKEGQDKATYCSKCFRNLKNEGKLKTPNPDTKKGYHFLNNLKIFIGRPQ